MALIILPEGTFEDGVLPLTPKNCLKSGCCGTGSGLSKSDIIKIVEELVSETNDKLMVNGKEKGVDNYVRSGKLQEDGNLKLDLGENKEADIDLSDLQTGRLTSDEIYNAAK